MPYQEPERIEGVVEELAHGLERLSALSTDMNIKMDAVCYFFFFFFFEEKVFF